MDIHVPIRVVRFLQPYIEKLGPFIEDIIRLVEPFAPKLAQTIGMLSQTGIQGLLASRLVYCLLSPGPGSQFNSHSSWILISKLAYHRCEVFKL